MRYLTVDAGVPGENHAIRVTFDALPGSYEQWDGTQMWVGAPHARVADHSIHQVCRPH